MVTHQRYLDKCCEAVGKIPYLIRTNALEMAPWEIKRERERERMEAKLISKISLYRNSIRMNAQSPRKIAEAIRENRACLAPSLSLIHVVMMSMS